VQAQLIKETGNNLESLLTGLWEDLFGFSPIGSRDDFFQLGGNSLHAARLTAKIRTLTGHNLPIESLLYAPTIERLALLMRDGETVSSSHMVTLREGNREQPLFFAHSLSGTMLELWALTREMDCHCAVYGIQGRGLREGEAPNSRVEVMAAEYVEQIRSVQPHGPYALAGFSFGGMIAFEMAQQLLRSGEKVELVALLDTQLDDQCLTFQDWVAHQLCLLRLGLREIRARSWRHRVDYIVMKAGHIADRLRVVAGKPPKHSGLEEKALRGVLAIPPSLRKIVVGLRVAMAAYRPKPYPGKVVFFHAAIPNPHWRDPLRVWKSVCRELEVVEMRGGHSDLILPPNARYVAQTLGQLLAVTQTRVVPSMQEASLQQRSSTPETAGNRGTSLIDISQGEPEISLDPAKLVPRAS
jgi:acetoacetyl-CoA synthetase